MITKELLDAIAECNLPNNVRTTNQKCYRKRFLIPNNPQNNGDFVSLIMDGSLEDEGVASWTTELKFAQDFKDPLRHGAVSAVFGHEPTSAEVILNIPELWKDPDFQQAVDAHSLAAKQNAGALRHFKARQSEIILNCPLRAKEIEGFCGRSSPFDMLCDLAGIQGEAARDDVWRRLVEAGNFPEQPMWLSKDAALRALANTETKFADLLRKLGR